MNHVKKAALILASAILPISTVHAMEAMPLQTVPSATTTETGCHSLMTEKECAAFRSALTSLPMGNVRDRFLAEHTALMREREALCSCNRANADAVIIYPRVQQVAQRF